jgi:hypothetical protein
MAKFHPDVPLEVVANDRYKLIGKQVARLIDKWE